MEGCDISRDEANGVLTFAFSGRYDSNECLKMDADVLSEIGTALAKTTPEKLTVVFNMAKAEYISSLFLRTVLKAAKKVPRGNFKLVSVNPFVKKVIQSSGLDMLICDPSDQFECMETVTESFPPPAAFSDHAVVGSMEEYLRNHAASIADPEGFFAAHAEKTLVWQKKWDTVREWSPPQATWFAGGQLNAAENCLDRHLNTPRADKVAILWEGEPVTPGGEPEIRRITYRQLHAEVCRVASGLTSLGFVKGDRAMIYMPMTPEAVIAMLACARIGMIHSVIFGGFSSQAIAERTADCQASLIITADGGYRRGEIVPLKQSVDEALRLMEQQAGGAPLPVRHVLVSKRTPQDIPMVEGRDLWWHDLIAQAPATCPACPMDSEDILFILYTSGSTGKPKGIYHSTAGYLLGAAMTHRHYFDIRDDDIYWCTADIGWITGHSYVVYGPLVNGATVLIYEGAPTFPDKDRFWSIVARHKVSILYTAPTAIRSFMQWGDEYPARHDLSSLRLLGTVGEPINPQAWKWFHEKIGGSRCPIVDTWWQTETGCIMLSTFPGAMAARPGAAGLPFYGIKASVLDDELKESAPNAGGRLFIETPWPSMCRGVWGDTSRFIGTYWSERPGFYFTGDGARRDGDGYFWVVGRIDDVLKVSGHRIGTAEVESALVAHPSVAEAAAVGRPDDIKEFVIVAFVTLKEGVNPGKELKEELRKIVVKHLGAIARPEEIRFTQALPKTRSGKIMRRLLKQVAAGADEISGDVTTLEDFKVVASLIAEEP